MGAPSDLICCLPFRVVTSPTTFSSTGLPCRRVTARESRRRGVLFPDQVGLNGGDYLTGRGFWQMMAERRQLPDLIRPERHGVRRRLAAVVTASLPAPIPAFISRDRAHRWAERSRGGPASWTARSAFRLCSMLRPQDAKTICRWLSPGQYRDYAPWTDNDRRIRELTRPSRSTRHRRLRCRSPLETLTTPPARERAHRYPYPEHRPNCSAGVQVHQSNL